MKFHFHPLARREFFDTINYYETRHEGLGLDFSREVYVAIQRILAYPSSWPEFSKSTRRCIVKRFPFAILYQNNDELLYIIAVMHLSRKPGYWEERK